MRSATPSSLTCRRGAPRSSRVSPIPHPTAGRRRNEADRTPREHLMSSLLRRILIGSPLPTHRAKHERLPKFLALPVFASDALSSSAYATQEILVTLLAAGAGLAAFR